MWKLLYMTVPYFGGWDLLRIQSILKSPNRSASLTFGSSVGRRISAKRWAANGSANNRQKYEVTVGEMRLLHALNVSHLCRNRRSKTNAREVRFGSQAASRQSITPPAAFECIPATQRPIFPGYILSVCFHRKRPLDRANNDRTDCLLSATSGHPPLLPAHGFLRKVD